MGGESGAHAMTGKKTWLEHVLDGEPFEMLDWDFIGATVKAKTKAAEFNTAPAADFERMGALLRELLGRVGENVFVIPPVTIDVGFNVEIGDRSFINANCTLLDTYPIRIGKDVQIGPNCAFYPVGHPLIARERQFLDPATGEGRSLTTGATIVIEDNVWIGGNTVILPGVTIGARSTIGAGSVVTKSVPQDVFAAGNPCRVLRALS
jgi:maltose O-acetyltransferase